MIHGTGSGTRHFLVKGVMSEIKTGPRRLNGVQRVWQTSCGGEEGGARVRTESSGWTNSGKEAKKKCHPRGSGSCVWGCSRRKGAGNRVNRPPDWRKENNAKTITGSERNWAGKVGGEWNTIKHLDLGGGGRNADEKTSISIKKASMATRKNYTEE